MIEMYVDTFIGIAQDLIKKFGVNYNGEKKIVFIPDDEGVHVIVLDNK